MIFFTFSMLMNLIFLSLNGNKILKIVFSKLLKELKDDGEGMTIL
jgi:hypothetical protein